MFLELRSGQVGFAGAGALGSLLDAATDVA
jgi:hypothetical protein